MSACSSRLLRDAGYTRVASTMNPHEVCALHRKNRYDLILLDLQMPGMDGFQVMEGLKTNDADGYLPVLVITAQPGHKLRALQAGAKDFISKPFDLVEVKTRIHNMLEVRLLYKKLENYSKVLEQTVQERTAELRESEARYRSLTELASDWYWEQDENGNFTKVSGPVLEMLGIRVDAAGGRSSGAQVAGWNEAEREGAAGDHRRPAAIPGFRLQPRQRRRLATAVPRQRRADVQPVLPLHRLPRHRRRTHRQATEAQDPDGQRCLRPTVRIRTICSPPCPRRNSSASSPHLELVPMPLGEILYEPGGQMQHAYFPTTAIVSLHYVMESGASAETAGVGNEGVVGISLFMGGDTTPSSAVVQTAGHAYRLERPPAEAGIQSRRPDAAPAAALHPGADHADDPDRGLQPAPFGGAAAVPLAVADPRSHRPRSELVMTQELVASMLGVRREGITEAAGNLQHAGFIRYRRGHISVLERVRTGDPRLRVLCRGQEGTGAACCPTCGTARTLRP